MSLNPTYNIVQRDLVQACNLFYEGKPHEANKAFTRVCNNSKTAEHGVYQKLWEVMGKPQTHPDYGRAAFWNSDGIHVESMKKSEAVYQYILSLRTQGQVSSTKSEGISNKARKVVRKLHNIIHPKPKNPTLALAVETGQLALSAMGIFMIGRSVFRILPKPSFNTVSEYSACSGKLGPFGNVMPGSGHIQGSNVAHLDFECLEHERQALEMSIHEREGRDCYERYERGEELNERDSYRAYEYESEHMS